MKIKKIYIMGNVGSGKSTLSRNLSKKYNIDYYELDVIAYDDANNHIRRTPEDIEKRFNNILKKDTWIIEDVGRTEFLKGREQCDIIYYIKISKPENLKRVITRWIKQRLGQEKYNYPPTFKQLIDMVKLTFTYFKKEKEKIKSLDLYKEKVIFINQKEKEELLND